MTEWILFFTFLAILWYSWETRQLRKWQKKQVQLTILTLDMQRVKSRIENPSANSTPYAKPFPEIIRKIYELGKFNAKDLYSSTYHQPISLAGRFWIKVKSLLAK